MTEARHVIVPLASGFEEIEAIATIDLLRRAGVRVTVAGVGGRIVAGSHGIELACDATIDECDAASADAVCLPGGMPGTARLRESEEVRRLVVAMHEAGRVVAAICAAPTALNAWGLLEGRRATSHRSHAHEMDRCVFVEEAVVVDGHVITSRGAGTAIEFAATLVAALVGNAVAEDILEKIHFQR